MHMCATFRPVRDFLTPKSATSHSD